MVQKARYRLGCVLFAVMMVAACAQGEPDATEQDAAAWYHSRAEEVVANPLRPAEDRIDDEARKPASVLAFISADPGITLFEIEAGSGYYTELFSKIVGPDGIVIMQYPASFDGFLKDAVGMRLAGNRLPNVRLTKSIFDNLDAETASVDIVTWLLGPHELYFTPSDGSSLGGVTQTYAEIYRILKPGGHLVILDHAAALGSSETTGGALHRIDPAIVKSLVLAAGFGFVDEADFLRNSDDQYEMIVFDPVVRRKTDRFLLKYKKPE